MAPGLENLLKRTYPVALSVEKRADGTEHYAAWLVDLPGCIAQGETREEATNRLNTLKAGYFAQLLKLAVPIPEPTNLPGILAGSVGFYDARTGMVNLRAPDTLRRGVNITASESVKSRLLQVA